MAAVSRLEFISPEGLRLDGRRSNELRTLNAQISILPHAHGSSLFQLGSTQVICTVNGPHDASSAQKASSAKLSINVHLHVATFSSVGGERKSRMDRRMNEWSQNIQSLFAEAIITKTWPRSQIDIYIEVLSADGSLLAAAINAVTLALIDASVPMYDYVLASSCVHLSKSVLLDCNRQEEGGVSSAHPLLTIASFARNPTKPLMISHDSLITIDQFASMTQMCSDGIQKQFEILDEMVKATLSTLDEIRK